MEFIKDEIVQMLKPYDCEVKIKDFGMELAIFHPESKLSFPTFLSKFDKESDLKDWIDSTVKELINERIRANRG